MSHTELAFALSDNLPLFNTTESIFDNGKKKMKLSSLTRPSLINLQTTFESRDQAIRALAEQLDKQGKLQDKEAYLETVFAREEQGPTALGEGLAVPHGKTDAVKEAVLENEFYQIHVNQNGTLSILDKQTQHRYEQVLRIEDGSDDGDEYDYSPSRKEWLLYSDEFNADIDIKHEGFQSVATIKLRMDIPADLAEREARSGQNGYLDVNCQVILKQGARRIDVTMTLDNQADDHRVRVLIPTPFVSEIVVADNQFGLITRPTYDSAMDAWEAEKWKEAPVPVYQLMNFAALENEQGGMALMTNGLREFEIISSQGTNARDTFALTLVRGIGTLGKEELLLRPGRPSGIKIPTPDSQTRGKLVCSFSLFGYEGDHISANVMAEARDNVTPIQCYNKIPYNAMKLNLGAQQIPMTFSLLHKAKKGAVLSVIKKAEDEKALIVRFYNPAETSALEDGLDFNAPISSYQAVRLDEQPLSSEMVEKASKRVEFGQLNPCQVKSFLVKL